MMEIDSEKLARFQTALNNFIQRIEDDRYLLAVVLLGSMSERTIWRKESIGLWIIEADGVSRRLRSDGNSERLYRQLVENGINIHAEVIPRTRFKQMVEGSSRTAFSCNFFEHRELVYSKDPSIAAWFEQANNIATKDQERELLTFSTWTIHASRHTQKRLTIKPDIDLAFQSLLNAAHSIACTEIIKFGEVWEQEVIYKAIEHSPDLFQTIYLNVLAKRRDKKTLVAALDRIDEYIQQNYQSHLKPLLQFLQKENRIVPLSEISDHFAFSQVYPWHLESACEWLERKGHLEKVSSSFKLTKRSQYEVEEPAYMMHR